MWRHSFWIEGVDGNNNNNNNNNNIDKHISFELVRHLINPCSRTNIREPRPNWSLKKYFSPNRPVLRICAWHMPGTAAQAVPPPENGGKNARKWRELFPFPAASHHRHPQLARPTPSGGRLRRIRPWGSAGALPAVRQRQHRARPPPPPAPTRPVRPPMAPIPYVASSAAPSSLYCRFAISLWLMFACF